jgi:hypothetical protein
MKKTVLILITTLCISMIGFAQTTFTFENITYKVTSNTTVEITAYDAAGGTDVVIPETVTNITSSYAVTNIANAAFYDKGLTSVVLGSNLKTIGQSAFYTNSLTSVVIPSSVTSIGFGAFWSNQITSLTIPTSVMSIGEQAFNDNKLSSITIPGNVMSLGDRAFGSNVLTSLTLSNGLKSIGAYAFGDNQLTSITIPSSVTSIGVSAFRDNPLTSVTSEATTPPSVFTSGLGDSFNADRSGIDLTIPAGTEAAYSVNAGAEWVGFKSISGLPFSDVIIDNITYRLNSVSPYTVKAVAYNVAGGASVTIPDQITVSATSYEVTEIGYFSFNNKSLTNLTIGNNVTIIDEGAFYKNQITNLILPNSVENVGEEAFAQNKITSIVWSNNLTIISEYAFGDNLLTSLTLPNSVTEIGVVAFQDNQLTSLTLPNNVISIGVSAFENNLLTSVSIPGSVTTIGKEAFGQNPLTSVTAEGKTPATIITDQYYDSFGNDRSSINLIIPSGTLGVYSTNKSALWTGFNSVTEDPTLSISSNFAATYNVSVYSNSNKPYISYNEGISLEKYTIYTTNGVVVSTGTESDLSNIYLTSGIYITKLEFNKAILVTKFFVQ